MVFWNEIFILKIKNICSKCKLQFAESEEEYETGLVAQCNNYPEYCIRCCP